MNDQKWTREGVRAALAAALFEKDPLTEVGLWGEDRGGMTLQEASFKFLERSFGEALARSQGYGVTLPAIKRYVKKSSEGFGQEPSVFHDEDGAVFVMWPNGKRVGFRAHQVGTSFHKQMTTFELDALPEPEARFGVTCSWPLCDCVCHQGFCRPASGLGLPAPCTACLVSLPSDDASKWCGTHGVSLKECGCGAIKTPAADREVIECPLHRRPYSECPCETLEERMGFSLPEEGSAPSFHEVGALCGIRNWVAIHCGECSFRWEASPTACPIPSKCSRCESDQISFAVAIEKVPDDPDPHIEEGECAGCGHPATQHVALAEIVEGRSWGCEVPDCLCNELRVKGAPKSFKFDLGEDGADQPEPMFEDSEAPPPEVRRGPVCKATGVGQHQFGSTGVCPCGQKPERPNASCKCGHLRATHEFPGEPGCSVCACAVFREGDHEPLITPGMIRESELEFAQIFDLSIKPKKARKSSQYHKCKLCKQDITAGQEFTVPKEKKGKISSRRAHIPCVTGTIDRLSQPAT